MAKTLSLADLLTVMARLRHPQTGCPWDIQQDSRSLAPFAIEEAYEVMDAAHRGDMDDLRDELGDLLLQVVFQAQIASEQQAFDFADVVDAITRKMIRRHPHVFNARKISGLDALRDNWERAKDEELNAKTSKDGNAEAADSLLARISSRLPPHHEARKLQNAAARIGFDFTNAQDALSKITEETEELAAALGRVLHRATAKQNDTAPVVAAAAAGVEPPVNTQTGKEIDAAIGEEIGDILFSVGNLCRHLSVDPESALKQANAKFRARFSHMERSADAAETALAELTPSEQEKLWQEAKKAQHIKAQDIKAQDAGKARKAAEMPPGALPQ